MASLFRDTSKGATLSVRVTPRSGRTAIAGARDGVLHVRLAAAPVDEAANEALVELLADVLGVGRRSIRIAGGRHGRVKTVVVSGHQAAALEAALARRLAAQ